MSIDRIRWHAGPVTSRTAWSGDVGTLKRNAFEIIGPIFSGESHTILSYLPGQQRRELNGDPEALKKAAEGWLVEFAADLGASFQDEPAKEAAQ